MANLVAHNITDLDGILVIGISRLPVHGNMLSRSSMSSIITYPDNFSRHTTCMIYVNEDRYLLIV